MKEWILSIVGVIALGVLVDIILPSGKLAKYVRGAFSLLVVLVMSSIIPIIANADYTITFDSSKYFSSEQTISADNKPTCFCEQAEQTLLDNGYASNVEIEWEGTIIKRVKVFVQDSSFDGDTLARLAASALGISKERVWVLYGET